MKKLLILFLLIIKPISAGSLLSKCFKSKSKPKVELTNSSQIEDVANVNIQEQNAQERNRLLAKYLLLGSSDINVFKVLEPLKIVKLKISPKKATEKLKSLCNETNDFTWHEFRHEAATLINSDAYINFNADYDNSLLNSAIIYQDYFFVYFLLKRGARTNRVTLRRARSRRMAELLISYGAVPYWDPWKDPLHLNITASDRSSDLLLYYIEKYKCSACQRYHQGNNLLHLLTNQVSFSFKNKVKILLAFGANPFEKNDLGESSIDIAKKHLNSDSDFLRKAGQDFVECMEEYNQTFKETLMEQTKDILPLELQDYIYKFHAGEDAELFAPKDS